ncbi:Uncharacterised protein [Mycobacteroides abscessus subsp. abscessus]|nr:Uncharacterised protein [Mycobacteroides abscessus subsp. abscessus]
MPADRPESTRPIMSCQTGPAVRKMTALIAERITPAAYTAKMTVVVVTPKPRSFA